MRDPHAFRFILGVISVLTLSLSTLLLPELRHGILLLTVIGLFGTWREYLRWRGTARP